MQIHFTLPENAHDLMKRDHSLRLGKSTEVNQFRDSSL
jgi:hypothetical protein